MRKYLLLLVLAVVTLSSGFALEKNEYQGEILEKVYAPSTSHTAAAIAGDQYSQKMKVTGRILVILEKEEK